MYTGTVTDGKYDYAVSYQLTKSSTDTTNVLNSATSNLQQQGFTPQQTNSTTWNGVGSNGYYAAVVQDTSNNFVFLLIQGPIGSG